MPRCATALNFVNPTGANPDFLSRKSEVAQRRDLQFHSDRIANAQQARSLPTAQFTVTATVVDAVRALLEPVTMTV